MRSSDRELQPPSIRPKATTTTARLERVPGWFVSDRGSYFAEQLDTLRGRRRQLEEELKKAHGVEE